MHGKEWRKRRNINSLVSQSFFYETVASGVQDYLLATKNHDHTDAAWVSKSAKPFLKLDRLIQTDDTSCSEPEIRNELITLLTGP